MIWAAESGGRIISVMPETVSITHTKIGSRPKVMPGPRMVSVVVTRLTAVAMVPMPVTKMARFQ